MLAAHKVYAQGANPSQLSRKLNLREKTLKKWVDYLRPNQHFRPHLLSWTQSEYSDLAEVAKTYQENFCSRFSDWIKELSGWRKRVKQAPNKGEEEKNQSF